jgi:hypothetical protein
MWLFWTLERGDFVINADGNAAAQVVTALQRFYNHELTITLDELPYIVV